ncbi:MAG: hypothetical protein K2Y31_04720 [Burkholderiales bacterium]|nr:hypothetical protein [Burkholderiales bacterium]
MIASAANAAGLGKLVVLSAMGEPFRAEIDLLNLTQFPDSRTTVTPRLASPEIYPPLGFRYNPALTGARLSIQSRANGRHVLELVSLQPLNEPFVYLLVELESDAARIVRGYTALLDPPGYRAPRQTAAVEYVPAVVPPTVTAVTPAAVRAPALDRRPAVARPAPRQDVLSNTDAKTLAAMLDRVAALETAVAQLQRHWEKPAVGAAAPPQAAPVAAQPAAVAAPAPPAIQAPVVQTKPAAPFESAPRRASDQDSLLNNALLVLAIGLLILLGGLVYVMWGRPAKDRPAKVD